MGVGVLKYAPNCNYEYGPGGLINQSVKLQHPSRLVHSSPCSSVFCVYRDPVQPQSTKLNRLWAQDVKCARSDRERYEESCPSEIPRKLKHSPDSSKAANR